MTDSPTTATGRLVADRYRLVEVLGRGGTADVHRAVDEVLGRQVAVKVLRDPAGPEPDRSRFAQESRTLAGFSHAGLVTVLDGGTDEDDDGVADHPFLVMELVEGATLAAVLRDGPLDPDRAAEVGAQLAEALAYVHDCGVVHRDVKPGNVLLGRDGRVKLADFGIARLLSDAVRHTRTGTTIGTAAYLSPEQVEGAEITPASDVWSLGLVLLEALTGEQSYPGTATEAALARLTRPPVVPAHLPARWRAVLEGALQRDPARRPSAAQVARALRSIGAGEDSTAVLAVDPDRAGPDATRVLETPPPPSTLSAPTTASTAPPAAASPPPRPARWRRAVDLAREHPPLVIVGALLLLVLVVAAVVGGDGGAERPAPVQEVPADVPPRLEPLLRDLHDAVQDGAR